MKHLVKIFVLTFFLLSSTYALAEQKIVYFDLKYVLNQSSAGKSAQDQLKKMFTDNQKRLENLEYCPQMILDKEKKIIREAEEDYLDDLCC